MSIKVKELGHVVFYVSNLEKSAAFYRDTLGIPEVGRLTLGTSGAAAFATGRNHHEFLLIEVGGEPQPRNSGTPGLYHIGLKIGDKPEDIKKAYAELQEAGVRIIGASDHQITHSLYILDPDGNEIELYADVSDEWKKDPTLILAPIKRLHLD
jgi:catechol 2,3-dioxygenase